MSEYSEKHSVARLVGAPSGVRRLRAGGQLILGIAVRRRPYSVVCSMKLRKLTLRFLDILLHLMTGVSLMARVGLLTSAMVLNSHV